MSVHFVEKAKLPNKFGDFILYGFVDEKTRTEHIALTLGDVAGEDVLMRVHSECLTGDALFSKRCDCGPQLEAAMKIIASEGRGVILYLRQEGRGIGLLNKIRAYKLQDQGADTVEANEQLGLPIDAREYYMVPAMLTELKINSVRLLTNNPAKINFLTIHGIKLNARIPLIVGANPYNQNYLHVKAEKMGHLI